MNADFLIDIGLLFGMVSAISYIFGMVECSVNGLSLNSIWFISFLLVVFPITFIIFSIPLKRKNKRR